MSSNLPGFFQGADMPTTALSLSDRQRESTMSSILDNKNTSTPSVFLPAALLRGARRQKGLATADVPPVCILDPDGDIVRQLRQTGKSQPFEHWPCYHTELDTFLLGEIEAGIVGWVVGASFAVLVAEELFASGCRLLVSLTSAGQVAPAGPPPYFVVIDRALRDEGTSYHYLPPSEFADADPELVAAAAEVCRSEIADDSRPELDHRRPFSRNGRSHRGGAHQRDFCGRNGSGGTLRFRKRDEGAGALSGARHKHDRDGGRGLRKGRGGWHSRRSRHPRDNRDSAA